MNDSKKWLYEQLTSNGYDVGKDYAEFDSLISTNADSRKWAYETARGLGYNVGKDYAEFESLVGGDTATTHGTRAGSRVETPVENANVVKSEVLEEPDSVVPVAHEATDEVQPSTPKKADIPLVLSADVRNAVKAEEHQAMHPSMTNMGSDETPIYKVDYGTKEENTEGAQAIEKARLPKEIAELEKEINEGNHPSSTRLRLRGELHKKTKRLESLYAEEQSQLRKDIAESLGDLKGEFEEMYKEESEKSKARLNYPKHNAPANPTAMSSYVDLGEIKTFAPASRAKHNMDRITDVIAEYNRVKSGGNWFVGAAKGLQTANFRQWDYGVVSGPEEMALSEAMRKHDAGEQLTKAEEVLLDTEAMRIAVEQAYKVDWSESGFGAGQITAESLPFMAQMMANPASGLGKGLTKGSLGLLSRYAARHLTRNAPKMAQKAAVKTATAGTRLMGDVAGATVMTGTTGAPTVLTDAERRAHGDVQYGADYRYGGHTKGDSYADALRKSAVATTIDNFTEMFPLVEGATDFVGKGLKHIAPKKVAAAIDRTLSSDFAKGVDNFAQKTQWHGPIEEYFEEVEAGLLNMALVGDEEWDEFWTVDKQMETFLGVALMGGSISAMKTLGYRSEATVARKDADKLNTRMHNALGADWDALEQDLRTPDRAGQVLADMRVQGYDTNIMEAALQYAQLRAKQEGAELAEMKLAETNPTVANAHTAYDSGEAAVEIDQKAQVETDFENADAAMREIFGENDMALLEGEDFIDVANQFIEHGADAEVVGNYINARSAHEGMLDRLQTEIDALTEGVDAEVDQVTNRDTGNVQSVKMKDGSYAHVVTGQVALREDGSIDKQNSSNSLVIYQDGRLSFTNPSLIEEASAPVSAEEHKQQKKSEIETAYLEQTEQGINDVKRQREAEETIETHGRAMIRANENGGLIEVEVSPGYEDGKVIVIGAKDVLGANVAEIPMDQYQQLYVGRPQTLVDEGRDSVAPNATETAPTDATETATPQTEASAPRTEVPLQTNTPAAEETLQPTSETQSVSPKSRIPVGENGELLYEQADADDAWDSLIEDTDGDVEMVQTVADRMVEQKKANLKTVQGKKAKNAQNVTDIIAAEKSRKAEIAQAQQELEAWEKIAGTMKRRQDAVKAEELRRAQEAEARRKVEAQQKAAEKAEALRQEREALHGVPDITDDTPQDARARGYRRVNGNKVDRQAPINGVAGKDVEVKFTNGVMPQGRVMVIEANELQPSHTQGQRNAQHFLDEAQPKERKDSASMLAAQKIAENIRPEEITTSVTAYTGAPTTNNRGEVIQGNSRSDALKQMWDSYPEQAAKYKQYLIEHAEELGLDAETVAQMERPVLVNMLEVADEDAITLGQFVAQDTESGGVERIKAKNVLQKMGSDVRNFANRLLQSTDEETSFAGLIDANGANVVQWMAQKGYITPTQQQSAYDGKGNLTAEAKNDLRSIMYQSIFKDGNTLLEEMFNALPVKAQKAILATAYRDFDSPVTERMIEEVQSSISAFYALSQDSAFASAKNITDARTAVEAWKNQYHMDDVTGESYLPSDKFSNFALHLATMYKGENQSVIQGTFNKMFDLIQGIQEADLFNENPDTTPRTLVEAIKEVLNIDYNGQLRSNVLGDNHPASQRGQQGSTGNVASGEQNQDGQGTDDGGRRTEGDSGRSRSEAEDRTSQSEEDATEIKSSSMSADEAIDFVADMELSADIAPEIDLTIENWDALFGENGTINTPIGEVKMGENQFAKLMRQGRDGKLGMIKPTLEKPHAIVEEVSEAKDGDTTERASSYIFIRSFKKADGSRYYYFTSITVSKDGREVVVSSQEKSRNKILRLLQEGSVIWRTPKDATTSSAERQGLDYEQPIETETATKGSGITPQSTSSDSKVTDNSPAEQKNAGENVSGGVNEQIALAESETDVTPTEGQKKAGNYKKGKVKVAGYEISIEQPKGSVRRGVDANGNAWEQTMHNTYGYFLGTEGVDGDHIDVFLANDVDAWNGEQVFVVDQYNEDGSFDEHKVMLGFNSIEDAQSAYLSNYEDGWTDKHNIVVTGTSASDFKKWVDSSHRKTKAFAEYKTVKTTEGQSTGAPTHETETLDNGDVRITNRNSRGDVATVAIERDGKIVSVDSYDDGALFEHTEYDAEGRATEVTRYGKNGEVVGVQEYDAGVRGKRSDNVATERTEEEATATELGVSLVKGAKWEETGEPEKFKSRTKKRADSHDVLWRIGKKQYGSTTAERDLLSILAEEYDSLDAIWNAYENGEILLSKNEAAILKKLIETGTRRAELQQGELDLDVKNPAFERATERTIDALKAAGVEVVEATDKMVEEMLGLAEMHKQKKAPETVSVQDEHLQTVVSSADKRKPHGTALLEDESSFKGTAISSDYGAKILKDLDSIIKKYENKEQETKTFLGDIASALGINAKDKSSKYATFEARNGTVFTIRISNHNATVSNFDNLGEDNGISIVVSRKPNTGIANDGDAHLVEFFYSDKKLKSAEGKPLVEILKSIKQALYSGEYKDTTGLAQAEEVNIPEFMQVYHGSGAKFDKFDHSFMGSGEGNQAFGWGTYVTDVEGIGRTYAGIGGQTVMTYKGSELDTEGLLNPWRIIKDLYDENHGRLRDMRSRAERILSMVEADNIEMKQLWQSVVDTLKQVRAGELKVKPSRLLYTVEIPDDNGANYLNWEEEVSSDVIDSIIDELQTQYGEDIAQRANLKYGQSGKHLYIKLENAFGSDKAASEFLNRIDYVGIKYPTESLSGGNKDGKSNYVIFNEADAKITDRVQFLRTADGVVYGWAVDGKIYLTKEGMNPNTPAHEYTHLWAHMIEKTDPVTWSRIVDGLRGCATWNEVLNDKAYESIWNDDNRMASEVLSRLTGSENYRREMARAQQEIADAKGAWEKAEKISAWEKVKMALKAFLDKVRKLLNINVKTAKVETNATEVGTTDIPSWMEFVNWALDDLYGGINPVEVVNRRGRDAMSVETIIDEFGLNPSAFSEIIDAREGLERYKSILDEAIYKDAIEDYETGAAGVAFPRAGITFVFKENCYDELEEQITWWHEQTHVASYHVAIPNKSYLANQALEWLKENAPEQHNRILEHYDESKWNEEGIATFIGELIKRYGTSNFLKSDFADLGELSTLADIIRNTIQHGTEDTKKKTNTGYRFGQPTSKPIPEFERSRESEGVQGGRPIGRSKEELGSIRGDATHGTDYRRYGGDATQGDERRRNHRASTQGDREVSQGDVVTREGDGSFSDDALSGMSDPMAKMLGASTYSARQRREFAERARKRMLRRAESIAKELHLDNVEVVTDVSVLPEGKKRSAKGFYSKSTGKITVVVPNHAGTYDIQQTVLHEAVAHYGLRQLFGTHFDTFLDNVFINADMDVRSRIVELSRQNGWNIRTATEEYLATLAENIEFSNAHKSGWWGKIKGFFLKMLADAGVKLDFTLSDNELRYILWRSYQNLANPGKYASVVEQAADIAKQSDLKVGNYRENYTDIDAVAEQVRDSEDVLFREDTPREREIARDRYERRVKTGWYQTKESQQDSMLGLKEALLSIVGDDIYIEDIAGFENAYIGENRLSSVNKAEIDLFVNNYFKPLYKIVERFAKTKEQQNSLEDYMFAKHGLERNRVMAEREAQKEYEEYIAAHPRGNKTLDDFIAKYREKDYAGLTGLTGETDVVSAEAEAQRMVEVYEIEHPDIDLLWEKWNETTKAILEKTYKSSIISKETFDNISNMYEYYVPMRGFDEKTSMDEYAYLGRKDNGFNPAIKKAGGRRSKADNPFAYLESMAESSIMQGNRNLLVKLKMLNFVLNHPSDLFSVSELWLEYNEVIDEWVPVFPTTLSEHDSPEEIQQKMDNFEARMEALSEADSKKYKRGRDAKDIPYRVLDKATLSEHQVIVRRNGRVFIITVNGNPRAAQALNGATNPDNLSKGAIDKILRTGEAVNRWLSANYTTRSPGFIAGNFLRDTFYVNTMVWVKESPNYALKYHLNWVLYNPIKMGHLYNKYKRGTLNMGNETDSLFYQFMVNGGETGYMTMRDIEAHKKEIAKKLRNKNILKKGYNWLSDLLDYINRSVENTARFAAFVTSRQMGRSMDRSIYDAKEISVNFNKKGSGDRFLGETGQTTVGNISSAISALGRSSFPFWNAAIQGSTNFGRQIKRHPKKALATAATMYLLGALIAYWGYEDDDDDEKGKYSDLPDYVRRSNIIIPLPGDSFISIPLPIEYRALYGMGELSMSVMMGKERKSGLELGEEILAQASQVLPLDVLEGEGGLNAFVPGYAKPIVEAERNVSWTGLPIYKDNPYNKNAPEYTKVYSNANKQLVSAAEWLNSATGGDAYTKGMININPAKVEHILKGYLGGYATTVDKMIKMTETATGEREYDPRSFLILDRVIKSGDERSEKRAINDAYYELKKEAGEVEYRMRGYKNDTYFNINDYSDKIKYLEQSPEYGRYLIFDEHQHKIEAINRNLKEANKLKDEEAIKQLTEKIDSIKYVIVEEVGAYDKMRKETGK